MSVIARLSVAIFSMLALASCNIAPQDAPWAKLSLEHPLGWTTAMKLARLAQEPQECRLALSEAQALIVRGAAPDAGTQDCPLAGAVAIERSSISYGQELATSCGLAAAIYVWEREVVQPAARTHFDAAVDRIETYGTFACRNIYGRAEGRRSEHASANALDVTAFVLSNGERVIVARDWMAQTRSGKFLSEVRDGSCRVFAAVLGPDYNAAHADHFHLDMGRYRICS